jgi:hypothetical protein
VKSRGAPDRVTATTDVSVPLFGGFWMKMELLALPLRSQRRRNESLSATDQGGADRRPTAGALSTPYELSAIGSPTCTRSVTSPNSEAPL